MATVGQNLDAPYADEERAALVVTEPSGPRRAARGGDQHMNVTVHDIPAELLFGRRLPPACIRGANRRARAVTADTAQPYPQLRPLV
jgi:hypothetical protein